MTEAECQEAFDQLASAIASARLNWVSNQVEEVIRFGQTVTKTVYSRPDAPEEIAVTGLVPRSRSSRVNVSATRPYTAQEKLHILLAALENAVIQTEGMEAEIRRYTNSHSQDWTEIRLVRTDEPGRQHLTVFPKEDVNRVKAVASLRTLLSEFKGLI